ncbi:MAG TPA: sigma-54 dependent transcriptional regulator [Polyangiaceae bacterium]|nr:sigma-54 dependent transcriptional regulator [Polyangiaceae bacterium]
MPPAVFADDDIDTPTPEALAAAEPLTGQYVQRTGPIELDRFGQMVGSASTSRSFFALLRRAAATQATVLLEGETGTGKEASAEAIHHESNRTGGPFIVVDCGAIPPQLLESELFGYERGAFTGAVAPRQGAFEAASGGTIFLDEIGELSIDLQPKILRVLERRHVKRIGSNTYAPVDVRVIAATNRSLRTEVAEKRFRSDLYYRLAVLRVTLPPLRERMGDMPLLVEHMLTMLGVADSPQADALRAPEFIAKLAHYRWPGNIRQLRNYLERCIALGDITSPPGADSIPPPEHEKEQQQPIALDQPLRVAREQWLNRFERRYLEGMLLRHGNNVSAAARAAGVDRIHFYRLLWKHGLRTQETEPSSGKARGARDAGH